MCACAAGARNASDPRPLDSLRARRASAVAGPVALAGMSAARGKQQQHSCPFAVGARQVFPHRRGHACQLASSRRGLGMPRTRDALLFLEEASSHEVVTCEGKKQVKP